MKAATCHPDKSHYAKGLCKVCYDRNKWLTKPHKQNPEVGRRKHVKVKFGLTLEAYDRQKAESKVCGLCKKPFGPHKLGLDAVLDHNHTTKRNREFLHRRCNAAIGLLNEDILVLEAAISYLKKWM